jgi:hypothetical protein
MSKSEEYREKAAHCQDMAEQCGDGVAKECWLKTAQFWLRLASQFDQTIARKSPPRAVAKAATKVA